MNEIKCGACVHYHPQERGSSRGPQEVKSYALCSQRSVYHEGATNVPAGAQTTKDPVAKPYVVTREMLVAHCEYARRA